MVSTSNEQEIPFRFPKISQFQRDSYGFFNRIILSIEQKMSLLKHLKLSFKTTFFESRTQSLIWMFDELAIYLLNSFGIYCILLLFVLRYETTFMIYFLLILFHLFWDRLIKVPSLKNFRQRKNGLRKEPILNHIVNSFLLNLKFKVSE